MSDPREILIVKLSAIGDVVHALPFLEVLGRRYPGAQIDWVVEEAAFPIVEGHPRLRKIMVSRRKRWLSARPWRRHHNGLGGQALRFVRDLRSRSYDLVVDLQGLLKSGIIVGLCRGMRKVGMTGSREGARFFWNEPPVQVNYEQHAIDRYLEVAAYLGCDPRGWSGRIPLPPDAGERVMTLLGQGTDRGPLIAINPMARWVTKLWEPEGFITVARALRNEMGCRVVLTGSDADRPELEAINEGLGGWALNLAGRTSLKELAALYTRCAVLVTTDTGPMHIAAAMGCPVVALFGPTAPQRTGPYGTGHRVLQSGEDCSPCFKKSCDYATCMKAITPESVLDAVSEVLGERREVCA